jgi:hypothetical protein
MAAATYALRNSAIAGEGRTRNVASSRNTIEAHAELPCHDLLTAHCRFATLDINKRLCASTVVHTGG